MIIIDGQPSLLICLIPVLEVCWCNNEVPIVAVSYLLVDVINKLLVSSVSYGLACLLAIPSMALLIMDWLTLVNPVMADLHRQLLASFLDQLLNRFA